MQNDLGDPPGLHSTEDSIEFKTATSTFANSPTHYPRIVQAQLNGSSLLEILRNFCHFSSKSSHFLKVDVACLSETVTAYCMPR